MCWNFLKLSKKKSASSSKMDEDFQRKVLHNMQVEIEGKKYLKADDLCKFFGAKSLEDVISSAANPKEILSKLIAYRTKNIAKDSKSISCEVTPLFANEKVGVNFKDKNIHYAFDNDILSFWKGQTQGRANEEYLYRMVQECFQSLNL